MRTIVAGLLDGFEARIVRLGRDDTRRVLDAFCNDEDVGPLKAHGDIFKTTYLDQVQPFPEARDLLAHVHASGCKVALASSASQDDIDHYLQLLDAHDPVAATTTSENVKRTESAPDIFAIALGKLDGLTADQVIVLGDTPYDMKVDNKCGIAAVALRSCGFSDDILWNAGAITIYVDVAALLAAFADSPLSR